MYKALRAVFGALYKMPRYGYVRPEEEIGIVCRLGSHPRFQGLFKERFSDFHVNEIDRNGRIVSLTDLEAPSERKSEVAEDDSQILEWIPEDVRCSIRSFQERLQEGCRESLRKSEPLWKERIEIKVTTLEKADRTKIHKWLGNFDKICSETVDKDGEKYIVALYESNNIKNKRRPSSRAKYTHCVLYKEGQETSEVLGLLSRKLRLNPGLITFRGTKDRRGKTTQRICIPNTDAARLVQISKEARSVKLGNFEYLPHHLRLGDHKGNHFKILLRKVSAESDEVIDAGIEFLRTTGFINYFGHQRFGSTKTGTHAVGKAVVQMNWLEAFDMILKPNNNDTGFMSNAKKEWLMFRDPVSAMKKFPPTHRSLESILLSGLAKHFSRNDYIAAWLRLPRNSRTLYIHSLQSYIWNKVASFRIELGLKPLVGDAVFVDKDENEFCGDSIEDIEGDTSESNNQSGAQPSPHSRRVKILTSDDLPNYNIYDVLIPVEGTDVKFSPDSNLKEYYLQLWKDEKLEADCFLNFNPACDRPRGAYRKLLIRPQNVSHKIIMYNDTTDQVDAFIPSEIDKLVQQRVANKNNSDTETALGRLENNENPTERELNKPLEESTVQETESVKDQKCVIVEFSLPASSYATMAMREIFVFEDSEQTACNSSLNEEKKPVGDEPEVKKIRLDA